MGAKRHRLNPRSISRLQGLRWLLAFLLLSAVWAATAGSAALAQDDLAWSTPENLSRSGAASSPVIVTVPNGRLRVIWWDQFDGLMVADGTLRLEENDTWSTPKAATLLVTQPGNLPGETVTRPIDRAPWIVGDSDGQAHAFWLGSADRDTGERALLYSRLSPGSTNWTSPRAIAGSASTFHAAVDDSGALHLAYVQPGQSGGLSSGLYYKRSRDGGINWSTAKLVSDSLYFRLLADEENSLRLTADSQDTVVVTWADPQSGQVMLTRTSNAGTTWDDPRPYATSDGNPLQSRVIAVPDMPQVATWRPAVGGDSLVAISTSAHDLLLTQWAGEHWTGTRQLMLAFDEPETGEAMRWRNLQVATLPPAQGAENGTAKLAVAGLDQKNDVWVTSVGGQVLEQLLVLPGEYQVPPVTLLRGGLASAPAIVAGSDGALHAFWWSPDDGLMAADGTISDVPAPGAAEENDSIRQFWLPARPAPLPTETLPSIVTDSAGGIHAFWLDTEIGEPGVMRLNHSRMSADGTAWLSPVVVAEGVLDFTLTTDHEGALHLVYFDTLDTAESAAGIYYQRLGEDGATWTPPAAVYQSRYLRLITPEIAHLRLAVEDTGRVYVSWDDPRLERALLARSQDGGVSWEPPVAVGDPEGQAWHGRLVQVPGGETLLIWQTAQAGGTCDLYQATAEEVVVSGSVGERVLDTLITCLETVDFLPLSEGQSLMVAGTGSDILTVALWDRERWSEPRSLIFDFQDPESGRRIRLAELQVALAKLPEAEESGSPTDAFVVVGTDSRGDLWADSFSTTDLELIFAAPPPWSPPTSISTDGDTVLDLPALAVDSEERLHVLWGEATASGEPGDGLWYTRHDAAPSPAEDRVQWIKPTLVLQSKGSATQPGLVSVGDQLHAVWSDGSSGEILYSRAFVRDAYAAAGWTEPVALPSPAMLGSRPSIASAPGGTIHVLYAVPVNEGRGIYHTRSDDGGESWSPAHRVFDATAAGWIMADYPRLAVDEQGNLHAVWVRYAHPGGGPPQGIYYARSSDGGETWSAAIEITPGTSEKPQLVATTGGQLHLVWAEGTPRQSWWHQWSTDGGQTWTTPESIPGFGDLFGPASLLADGRDLLYLAGIGRDDIGDMALLFSVWNGQRWSAQPASRLELTEAMQGVTAALISAQGRFDVIFPGESPTEGTAATMQLWHTWRQVPSIPEPQAPATSLQPTQIPDTPSNRPLQTPSSTSEPKPALVTASVPALEASPAPAFGTAPPLDNAGDSPLPTPLLVAGGLATLIVAIGFAMVMLRTRNR